MSTLIQFLWFDLTKFRCIFSMSFQFGELTFLWIIFGEFAIVELSFDGFAYSHLTQQWIDQIFKMSINDSDVFKDVFKFYKRRDRPLDLGDAINFHELEKWADRVQVLQPVTSEPDDLKSQDLIPCSQWNIYKLLPEKNSTAGEGIFYIRNPFTNLGKSYKHVENFCNFFELCIMWIDTKFGVE